MEIYLSGGPRDGESMEVPDYRSTIVFPDPVSEDTVSYWLRALNEYENYGAEGPLFRDAVYRFTGTRYAALSGQLGPFIYQYEGA